MSHVAPSVQATMANASPACLTLRGTSRNGSGSSATRSGSFMSTSPRFRPPRASFTSSWASTGQPSSPSPSSSKRPTGALHGNSCSTCSKPDQVHTILTANGNPVRGAAAEPEQPSSRGRCASTFPGLSRPHRGHGPLQLCEGAPSSPIGPRTMASGIKHRLTEPNHPWTNGQVERMNRAGSAGGFNS